MNPETPNADEAALLAASLEPELRDLLRDWSTDEIRERIKVLAKRLRIVGN